MDPESIVSKHGGYRELASYRLASVIYDLTVRFCDRYVERRSRTHDQMVQAARSGVQNIAEGSQVSGTSKKMELKLTSVARASLEELKCDYRDFLRQRRLPIWDKKDPRREELIRRRPASADDVARWALDVGRGTIGGTGPGGWSGRSGLSGRSGPSGRGEDPPSPSAAPTSSTESTSSTGSTPSTGSTSSTPAGPPPSYPEIAANGALALINVAGFLLDRQIRAQAEAFRREGGFTERLYRERTKHRRPKG